MAKFQSLQSCGTEDLKSKDIKTFERNGQTVTIMLEDGTAFSIMLPEGLSLKDCTGAVIAKDTQVPTCTQMDTAVRNTQTAVERKVATAEQNAAKLVDAAKTEARTRDDALQAKMVLTGRLVGSDLVLYGDNNVEKARIPLSGLIPAAKADRFLKNVTYNNKTKKLVFTVGDNAGGTDSSLEANVADLLPIVTSKQFTGKGTEAEPLALNPNEVAWQLTVGTAGRGKVSGKTTELIGPKETVTLTAGDGIHLKQDANNITIELDNGCERVTNLNICDPSNTDLQRLGFTCFHGAAGNGYNVIGIPVTIVEGDIQPTTPPLKAGETLAGGFAIDWVGFQVATSGEVIQFVNNNNNNRFFTRSIDNIRWNANTNHFEIASSSITACDDVLWTAISETAYRNAQKDANKASGLDCAAIAKLPKRAWRKGDTLLAHGADGSCFQMQALDDIFTDISLGIQASKTYGGTDEPYHVVYTVTNGGTNKAAGATLNIVEPAGKGTDYTVSNVTVSKTDVGTATRNGNTVTMTDLQSGGYVRIEFDVTPKKTSTYTFGGQVMADGVDTNSANNTATIVLSARALNTTEATVDCPLIEVTDVETGTKIPVSSNSQDLAALAIYADKTNLTGTKVRIKNGYTIVAMPVGEAGDNITILSNGRVAGVERYASFHVVNNNDIPQPEKVVAVDFVNGVLTVPTLYDKQSLSVAVRPNGTNCKWQLFVLVPSYPDPRCTMQGSGVSVSTTTAIPHNHAIIGNASGDYLRTGINNTNSRRLIEHKAGTAKTYTVTASCDAFASGYNTSGRVSLSPVDAKTLRIVVSADATAQDSVTIGRVQVKIKP